MGNNNDCDYNVNLPGFRLTIIGFIAAPEDMGRLFVEGYNASTMGVQWQSPAKPNSPVVRYELQRTALAFNFPPPRVERGIRFPGGGFYRFRSDTIPQGVTFHG